MPLINGTRSNSIRINKNRNDEVRLEAQDAKQIAMNLESIRSNKSIEEKWADTDSFQNK